MLKIVDLEGNHLATIDQEADSELTATVVDESIRQELHGFLERIQQGGVYLVGGVRDVRGEQVIHRTTRKQLQSGNPDYLKGVRDMIQRSRLSLGGRRVRALLIEKQD